MDVVNPDIVLVCCGGGGLLAGISYGLSALGSNAIVYGVEPETANTMYQSFEKGKPVMFLGAKSIASGLAPPLTGILTLKNKLFRYFTTSYLKAQTLTNIVVNTLKVVFC